MTAAVGTAMAVAAGAGDDDGFDERSMLLQQRAQFEREGDKNGVLKMDALLAELK